MRAIVLLADSAQVDPHQKVHALGLGWNTTAMPTPPAAVVVLFVVPWTATNQRHRFALHLVDGDGEPVTNPEAAPIRVEGEFEMGRPPGAPQGSDLIQPFVVPIPPGLGLRDGQTYEWSMDINGHHEPDWSARFSVRASLSTP